MTVTSKTYSFTRGEKMCLDDIYEIQAIGDGDWWERVNLDIPSPVCCTKTIKITITVEENYVKNINQ